MQDRYSAFSAKDISGYLLNIYDKLSKGANLTFDEEDFLIKLPDNLLEDVDELKQFHSPIEEEPEQHVVQRVRKKKPSQPKLTQEETDELLEDSPEMVVLNQFFPLIGDDTLFFNDDAPNIDASINTLLYLRELGYTTATWYTGPEYDRNNCHRGIPGMEGTEADGKPVCEYRNGKSYTITQIIAMAQNHSNYYGYKPPKPFLAMAHPGCRCYFLCEQPSSADGVPNTAPGIPTFGEPEEILSYKQQIFSKLRNFPVDRWTLLSPVIYTATENANASIVDEDDVRQTTPYAKSKKLYKKQYKSSAQQEDRLVIAESEWVDAIKPIRISKSYLFRSSIGPVRPIPDTYFGFQTSESDAYSIVFLGDLARKIIAPRDCVEEVKLRPIPLDKITANSYIGVDDSYGLVVQVLDDNKVSCFVPDFDEIVTLIPEVAYEIA